MTFLTAPIAWALALLLPLVVVMYLLKLKRKRVVVPSTLLWRRSVQDLVANAPFQKLRNNLLLWLQLLILALLILAFMRPVMEMTTAGGTRVVLLVDNSATMAAREADGQTRLEKAQREAITLIESLSGSDEAIVIAFSNRATIMQTFSSDRTLLRRAVEDITIDEVAADIEDAARIATNLTTFVTEESMELRPLDNTLTVLISDGAMHNTQSLVDVPALRFVQVGETEDNVGITAVDVRESFAQGFEYQVFASITNGASEERTVFAELLSGDALIDIKAVDLAPGATSGVVFSVQEELSGVLTVRLDVEDALALDNIARVRLTAESNIDVLLVSRGNMFLEQVLAIDPRVSLSVMRPADYSANEEYSLVVFDNVSQASLPPGNFLFIGGVPVGMGFSIEGGTVRNPSVVDWNRIHPVNRFANFDGVLIGEAPIMEIPSSAIPLVEAVETPLIALMETDSQRVVVVGFDIFKSYWPLDVSFPIFISNTLEYIARGGRGGLPSYPSGASIAIVPERDSSSATITTPRGRSQEFSFEGFTTQYFADTLRTGVYELRFDNGIVRQMPVNLVSEDATRIAPVGEIDLGPTTIAATEGTSRMRREVWPWVLLVALGVLVAEWWIYCRRTFM